MSKPTNNSIDRRKFTKLVAGSGLMITSVPVVGWAANATGKELHGLSSFGALKYGPDFEMFDYASPEAPKGGTFAFSPSNWQFNQNTQTFNTLNSFVLKGAAPPRMELCFDTLMVRAIDEPDAQYCALAESVSISEDRNSYIFKLRTQARFHDGSVLDANDVKFSYDLIKEKGHPQLSQILRNIERVEVVDPNTVKLVFNTKQSSRAILLASSSVPIFSAKYFETHAFDSSTLDIPLSSGPWKVGKFSAGDFIEYERVKDYWAKDLPFAKGFNHFDTLRIDFFAERSSAFEAFKKGDILWREEFTSKTWATSYDFAAVKSGKIVQKHFADELRPSMQGWAINTRRAKFEDIRVRQAIGLCFDFEWTNKNLFYGAYTRSQSLFETSSFKAEGKPSAQELALLQSLKGEIPPAVMGEAVTQPVSDGSGSDRSKLRAALKLFKQAGWQSKDGKLRNGKGEQFTIEFLIRSKSFEKVLAGMVNNLRQLGATVQLRLVDPSQYQARTDAFDYDIIGEALSLSSSPTKAALRQLFHSTAADIPGSRNRPGVRLAIVDQLVDKLGEVQSREELTVVMRVLDRVLRAYQFWIPNWYSANHRIAMWDVFGWKEPKPDYDFPVEQLWWYDEAKAKRIGKG